MRRFRPVLLLALPSLLAAGPEEDDLRWADHLYRTAEYAAAAFAYRRLLFLHPRTAADADVPRRLAWSYLLAGDHPALRSFLFDPGLDDPVEARYLAGLSALLEGRWLLAYERLAPLLDAPGLTLRRRDTVRLGLAVVLAAMDEPRRALGLLDTPPQDAGQLEAYARTKAAIRRLPRSKNPEVAAVLGLLPGAGFLYAEDIPKAVAFVSAAALTGLGGWLSLSDRDWSSARTRDILDLSLWSAGALLLLTRSSAESWQAAEEGNRRRLRRIVGPFLDLRPWDAPRLP